MPKNTLDEASDFIPPTSLLHDIHDTVKQLTLTIGGNPLVTDPRDPTNPINSIVGRLRSISERQDSLERKIDDNIKKSRDSDIQIETKIAGMESTSLSKKAVLDYLWKYKVRVLLILGIAILNGPAVLHYTLDRWRSLIP